MHAQSLQSCPTLCNPMGCCPPDVSVPGILQARILEWIAISFSKGSSRPRDRTRVSFIGRQILHHWATGEALMCVCARARVCVCVQVGNLHRSSGSQGLRGPQALRSACFCLSTDSSVGWRGSCWAMASSLSFLGRHTWIQSPLPSANSKLLLGGFYNIEPYFPLHGTAVRMKRGHLGASICHLVRACFLSPSFLLVISSFVTVVREILPAHCGHFKLGCIHLYV